MDEQGFYKNDNGELLYAPNFVYNKNYTLLREESLSGKDKNIYPVDGWRWFEKRRDALDFYGIEENTVYDLVESILKEQGKEYQIDPGLKQFPVRQSDYDKFK